MKASLPSAVSSVPIVRKEKPLPFQYPESDPNLKQIIDKLERCELSHRARDIAFTCENSCPVFQSCVAYYDITANQCRDYRMTPLEMRYACTSVNILIKASWGKL